MKKTRTQLGEVAAGKLAALNTQLIKVLSIILAVALVFLLVSIWLENSRLQSENTDLKNTIRDMRESSIIKAPTKSTADIVAESLKDAQKKVPLVDSEDFVQGPRNAKLFLVEYGDLECPYCKRFHTVLKDVRAEYGDSVAIVYRHLPLNIHPAATMEALASICVAQKAGNDAFFTYITNVYDKSAANGTSFTQEQMISFAKEQGIDTSAMASCIASDAAKARLQRDLDSANAAGIKSTPTSYLISGKGVQKVFSGNLPFSAVKVAIDDLIR